MRARSASWTQVRVGLSPPASYYVDATCTDESVLNDSLNLLSYVSTNLLAELPGVTFISLLATAIIVYFAGVHTFSSFFLNLTLCEGFMTPAHSIPSYWLWGYYVASHTYSFESFMYEHFSHVDTSEAWKVLEQYGMQSVNVSKNMLILVVYAAGVQVLFVAILYFFRGGRRK